MAFGQASGPPATARQVKELLALLEQAGHVDFRDARGPMGFTQRQAAGKFTRDEADTFIAALQVEAEGSASADAAPAAVPSPPPSPRSAAERALAKVSDAQLAAELQRRGWVVMEP